MWLLPSAEDTLMISSMFPFLLVGVKSSTPSSRRQRRSSAPQLHYSEPWIVSVVRCDPLEIRLHFADGKIKVWLRRAVASGAHPRRI